jgi:hypothetical protein
MWNCRRWAGNEETSGQVSAGSQTHAEPKIETSGGATNTPTATATAGPSPTGDLPSAPGGVDP